MVLENISGAYMSFYICPARRITEEDLTPISAWRPVGRQAEEAQDYLYSLYGFEKVCDRHYINNQRSK